MADNTKDVLIRVNADTSGAKASLNELAGATDNISKIPLGKNVKSLKEAWKLAQKEAGQYASLLHEAERELEELVRTGKAMPDQIKASEERIKALTTEFDRSAKNAANLKDKAKEMVETITAFNPDNKLQAVVGVSRAAVAGIQGIAGAFTLVGVESDNAQKIIAKLQGLAALSDMLNSVDDIKNSWNNLNKVIPISTALSKANAVANNITAGAMRLLGASANATSLSFQALKVAIISTGIGALVVGITTLLPVISNWISGTNGAEEAQKRLEGAVKAVNDALQDNLDMLNFDQQILEKNMRIAGKTEKEIKESRIKNLEEQSKKYQQAYDDLYDQTQKEVKLGKAKNEEIQKNWDKLNEISKNQSKVYENIALARKDIEVDAADETRKKKKEADDKAEQDRKTALDKEKAHNAQLKAQRDAELKQLDEYNKEAQKYNRQSTMTDRSKELDDLREEFEKKKQLFDKYGKDTTQITKEYYIQKQAIEKKYNEQISDFLNDILLSDLDKQRYEINKKYDEMLKNATSFSQKVALLYAKNQELTKVDDTEKTQKLTTEANTNVTKSETNLVNTQIDNKISDDDTPEQRKEKMQNIYNAQIDVENKEYERKKLAAQNNADELANIEANHKLRLLNMADEQAEAEKRIDDAKKEAKIANMAAVGNALNAFADIVGKQTVAGKALAVAAATIDTYQGVTKALGAYPPPFNFVAAAAVGATGILNIKKIIDTKVPGKGSGGASAPTIQQAPTINAVQLGQQQIQDVRVTNQNQQAPLRAYIVDRDLSQQQQKSNLLNNLQTF